MSTIVVASDKPSALYEKEAGVVQIADDDQDGTPIDWEEDEEKKLVKKIDLIILPMLILVFFSLQLNRGNIGGALTNGFLRDVGITQFQFNVGQQLLSLGIVLFEIPSNMVLYRTGPNIWLGSQVLAWGLVGSLQSLQKGYASYLATRLLLGRYYKTEELGKRFAMYFLGALGAGAFSGLIAFGTFKHLDGNAGMHGWQWLFLIEGLIAIGAGIVMLLLFPADSKNPVPLLGFQYFSDRESHILYQRVIRDDRSKLTAAGKKVSMADLKQTFTNWRLLPHVIITISGIAPVLGMGTYVPSLIAGMGYGNLDANAMMSIGAWLLVISNLFYGWLADRVDKRGPLINVALLCNLAFTLANRLLIYNPNRVTRFAVLTVGSLFSTSWHALHGSWLAINSRTDTERSITMAIHVMGANIAGIVGAQLFQHSDNPPIYPRGWAVIFSLVTLAFVASLVATGQYVLLNRLGKHPGDRKYKI